MDDVRIHWGKGLNKILSNMAPATVNVLRDGVRHHFTSVEAAYQACKTGRYVDTEYENCWTGMDAYYMSRARKVERGPQTYKLMEVLLLNRARNNPDFVHALIDTYPHNLTHPVSDRYWRDAFPALLEELRFDLISVGWDEATTEWAINEDCCVGWTDGVPDDFSPYLETY